MKMYVMKGVITFRNDLWDTFIEFISKLKEYPNFEVMDGGRYKVSINQVYDRALERMRIDSGDLATISRVLNFLGERDVTGELVEYMNENKNLGYRCLTTADGEKIIKEAEAIVKQRNQENEVKQMYDEAKKRFNEAEKKKEEYLQEQNSIIDNFANAKEELEYLEEKMKSIKKDLVDTEQVMVDEVDTKEEEVIENE